MIPLKKSRKPKFAKLFFTFICVLILTAACAVSFCGAVYAKKTVRAKSISVSNIPLSTYSMKKGYRKRIKVKFTPSNTTDKRLRWKSSNPRIVKVKNGVIKALKNGSVKITATTRDKSKKKAAVKIVVGQPVKKVNTDFSTAKIASGKNKSIAASVLPANASVKNFVYSSSNAAVAHVSQKGIITAKKSGAAKITVRSADSRSYKRVKVNSYYSKKYYTMTTDEKVNAKDLCYQSWLSSNKNISFSSSNKNVAKVTKSGNINPQKKGSATITLYNANSPDRKTLVSLKVGTPVESISIVENNSTIQINTRDTHKLGATVSPQNASTRTLIYSSSNESVATVSEKGVVTGISRGSAKITVSSKDSRAKLTVYVKVFDPAPLTVDTLDGRIKGYNSAIDIAAWHDVPFAKPPVDELRWKAPRDNEKWSGTLNCTTTTAKCSQYSDGAVTGSEDCLYLNINRPNTDETGLPVIVYLHGGSNLKGSKSGFNTKAMVRRGNVVFVSVNYRLGAFGFFKMDALNSGDPADDSGNYAILDIKKALEWIRDNIEKFGGDKNNITLSGFSAGAKNVASCLISPLFKGLFHKAVLLSGSATEAAPDEAQSSAVNAAARIMLERGLVKSVSEGEEWFKTASDDEIKELLYSMTSGEVARFFSASFNKANAIKYAIKDGYVIPSDGFEAIRRGDYNKVPLILGSCESEFSGFLLAESYFDSALETQSLLFDEEKSELAKKALYYTNMLYAGFNVDATARALALAQPQPIYCYRFSWGLDPDVTGEEYFSTYIGAHHGSDIDFLESVFGNNHSAVAPNLFSDDNISGRRALSGNMIKYIANFICGSDPNGEGLNVWEPWTASSMRLMNFNADRVNDISAMTDKIYFNEKIWPEAQSALGDEFLEKYVDWRFFGLYRDLFWWIEEKSEPPEQPSDEIA